MPTNSQLVESIEALVALDAIGALVPHGLTGITRDLLEQCAQALAPPTPSYYKNQRIDGSWTPPQTWIDCQSLTVAVKYQRTMVPFYEVEIA